MKEVIDRIMRIDGMTAREEIEQLYTLAKEAKHGIAEIGCWRGRSTVALALGSLAGNKVPVYAIDPHDDFHAVAETSEYQFSSMDRAQWMSNILSAGVGRGHDVARIVRLVNLPSVDASIPIDIDLLFIDGDHTQVYNDFMYFETFTVEGATVLIHENNEQAVKDLIENVVASGEYKRFPDVALTARLLRLKKFYHADGAFRTHDIAEGEAV